MLEEMKIFGGWVPLPSSPHACTVSLTVKYVFFSALPLLMQLNMINKTGKHLGRISATMHFGAYYRVEQFSNIVGFRR